jgi:transcriptional regulator with XRE-family HTH domain
MPNPNKCAPDQGDAFATFLVAYRARHGITQAGLAARIGVDHTAVCRWEGKRMAPTLPAFRRFLRYGGLSLAEVRAVVASVLGLDVATLAPTKAPTRGTAAVERAVRR